MTPGGEHERPSIEVRPRAVRIGITGPIGCGKSTVARWLGDRRGVVVVDADKVAREVLDRGEPALEAVIGRFGRQFLLPNGELDRPALGRLVFGDPAMLRDLESIVHPAVRPRILAVVAEAEASGSAAVIIEAIKLVEGGLAAECDEVWLVTCEPDVQRARLIDRGVPRGDAEQRVLAQGDLTGRIGPLATQIIDTSGTPAETRPKVEAVLDDAVEAHHRASM